MKKVTYGRGGFNPRRVDKNIVRKEDIPVPPHVVREERNVLLKESDWTQVSDAPLTTSKKSAWRAYRKALRDITLQDGFPNDVVWPEKPSG